MKNIILTVIAFCAMTSLYAQNVSDAFRYSSQELDGTARFQAMSGAFTALGGDISSISLNPASSSVFLDNAASISIGLLDTKNNASYFNTNTSAFNTDLSLNQAGTVFIYNNFSENSKWKKFALGINYNNTNNYDNEIFIAGNSNTSISNFFLQQAQGVPLDLLQLQGTETISDLYRFLGETEGVAAQNAFLGFQGFIIDPLENNPENTAYVSNTVGSSFNQEYISYSSGYNGKFSFNFSGQYTENYYFGINLNSHTIEYRNRNIIDEKNNNTGSSINSIIFENSLNTLGAGFSAQVGGIAKIEKNFRVGITYDTPTWYEITEETTQYLETERSVDDQLLITVVDPRVINLFQSYQFKTPGKLAVGAAYIFGEKGFLSFDYGYKNYGNTKFGGNGDSVYFNNLNNFINTTLKGASTYKLGGEYRIEDLSLRAGIRHEESPYEDEVTVGDLNGISLGFGYKFGNYALDFSYARAEQETNELLYSEGLTTPASVNTITSNFILTFGIQF